MGGTPATHGASVGGRIGPLAIYAVGSAVVALAQRYLVIHFDTFTLNAGRLLAGAATLLIIAALYHRRDLHETLANSRHMAGIALLGAAWFGSMFCLVQGMRLTSAVLASLVITLGVPLSIGVTVVFFPDERRSVRSGWFVLGSILALGGTVGLALAEGELSLDYSAGVLYVVGAALILAAGSVLTKRLAVSIDPYCVSGLTSAVTGVLFLAASIVSGGITTVARAPLQANLVLFGSGVYGLVVGGSTFFLAIRRAGLVMTRVAELSTPVFVGLLAFPLFGESLNPLQIACGVVLLAGCVLVVVQSARS